VGDTAADSLCGIDDDKVMPAVRSSRGLASAALECVVQRRVRCAFRPPASFPASVPLRPRIPWAI